MPLTSGATDAVGVVTLMLVFLICVTGALCMAYVLRFHYRVGKERRLALRDFDSPWLVRIFLIGFTVLWGLAEVLRLNLLRKRGWPLHSLNFAWQANICRFHVVSSFGILEPGFFLTSLFLVQASLYDGLRFFRSLNARVFSLLVVFCLPLLLLQSFLVVTSSSLQFHREYNETKEGYGGALPSYFTRSFEVEMDEANTRLAFCTYPLFSVLLLGLFGLFFVAYFSYLGVRMLHLVINRKLRMRVLGLMVVVVILLPLHVFFLGFSVRLKASRPAHEISTFIGFVTLFLCTSVGEWILVFRPIADALAVRLVLENSSWQSFSASSVDPFGRSVSAFVSDDEEGAQLARISLLGHAVSSTGADAESSHKKASMSFDTMLKDATFGPGNRVAEMIGSVASPGSPELPGEPLISTLPPD